MVIWNNAMLHGTSAPVNAPVSHPVVLKEMDYVIVPREGNDTSKLQSKKTKQKLKEQAIEKRARMTSWYHVTTAKRLRAQMEDID